MKLKNKRLPAHVVQKLASLARIPRDQLQDFKGVIDIPVLRAWALDRPGSRKGKRRTSLDKAAKLARQLSAELGKVSPAEKVWAGELWSIAPVSYRLPDLFMVSSELKDFLNFAVGHGGLSGNGTKRPGTVHKLGFHEFVRGLLLVTECWCSGKLTLHNERGTGPLIDALILLRTHLPRGLVPISPPFGTVRRIRNQHRKLLKGKPISSAYQGYPDIDLWRAQI